jgi:hypothetical protein
MSGPRGVNFSRRAALARLAALVATAVLPRRAWSFLDTDPLDGTIADYAAVSAKGSGAPQRSPHARSGVVA